MKIASGPMILARPVVRTEAAQALASGESLFISAEGAAHLPAPAAYPEEVTRQIEAGRKLASSVGLSDSAARHLNVNVPGMAVGGGTGAAAGAAIGVLMTQLKAVHPTSGALFDAACAVLGAAVGTAVGSGQFKVEGTIKDGAFGLTVSPESAK